MPSWPVEITEVLSSFLLTLSKNSMPSSWQTLFAQSNSGELLSCVHLWWAVIAIYRGSHRRFAWLTICLNSHSVEIKWNSSPIQQTAFLEYGGNKLENTIILSVLNIMPSKWMWIFSLKHLNFPLLNRKKIKTGTDPSTFPITTKKIDFKLILSSICLGNIYVFIVPVP